MKSGSKTDSCSIGGSIVYIVERALQERTNAILLVKQPANEFTWPAQSANIKFAETQCVRNKV
jgi:hypothetical protein